MGYYRSFLNQFGPVWTSFIPMWLYKSYNFGQRVFQWMTWEIKWDKKVAIVSDFWISDLKWISSEPMIRQIWISKCRLKDLQETVVQYRVLFQVGYFISRVYLIRYTLKYISTYFRSNFKPEVGSELTNFTCVLSMLTDKTESGQHWIHSSLIKCHFR